MLQGKLSFFVLELLKDALNINPKILICYWKRTLPIASFLLPSHHSRQPGPSRR